MQEYIRNKRPYLNPELTLNQLSDQVGISHNYLSQIINEGLGTNFLDLINQYRVGDVKVQLSDPVKSHLTIIAIGFDSGFNSKSAFYSAFKKHTGMTPSDYRK